MRKYAQVCATGLRIVSRHKGGRWFWNLGLDMSKIFTARELADYLKVKPETVRRWARTGRIPYKKFSAKVMRFDSVAVQRALDSLAREKVGGSSDH